MNSDLNKNGIIDILEQQIQHASTSTISNFATVAKKASEIQEGANKCYFNKVNKCLVIKHGNKPMTDCLQLGAKHNTINNVESIHFQDESTLAGVVDSMETELTEDEAKTTAPTMNLLTTIINDISPGTIYGQLDGIATKTHDLSYNSTTQTTTINHNLEVIGDISSDWLDNEFAKYALLNHNHDSTYAALNHNHNSTYAALNHNHEFVDIYKQTTRTIVNQTTNEEEEITETKTLQQVLTEYEQSLTNTINQGLNNKANVSHTHEISNIYKSISVQNQDGTTTTTQKPLETLIEEKDSALRGLINGKANSSHSHNATDVVYKTNVNVKQAIDSINQQLDINDSNGNKIDLLAAIFGTTTGIGAVVDGGLVYAVLTLQTQVAALQAQITAVMGESLGSDTLEAFDAAGDVVGQSSNAMSGLQSFANCFSRLRNTLRGYTQVTTETITPATAGLGEVAGLVAL